MDSTTRALLGLLVWLLLGVAYCVAATIAARRSRATTIWTAWSALFLSIASVQLVALWNNPFVREIGLGYAAIFAILLPGLPSAAATWRAVGLSRRAPRRGVTRDLVAVLTTSAAVLFATAVLLALPDFLGLLRG